MVKTGADISIQVDKLLKYRNKEKYEELYPQEKDNDENKPLGIEQ